MPKDTLVSMDAIRTKGCKTLSHLNRPCPGTTTSTQKKKKKHQHSRNLLSIFKWNFEIVPGRAQVTAVRALGFLCIPRELLLPLLSQKLEPSRASTVRPSFAPTPQLCWQLSLLPYPVVTGECETLRPGIVLDSTCEAWGGTGGVLLARGSNWNIFCLEFLLVFSGLLGAVHFIELSVHGKARVPGREPAGGFPVHVILKDEELCPICTLC